MDYFLKAADEASMLATLIAAGILLEIDGGHVLTEGIALDVIGQINKPTGAILTVDGMDFPEIAAVPGWHANLRGELSDTQLAALEPILLEQPPANPYRVWA